MYASPAAAAGRIYLIERNGAAIVLEGGPEFKVLARNKLNDTFNASPVIVGRQLFLRGETHLYCVGE
jgi:outer membrane protein assembly factor BamB